MLYRVILHPALFDPNKDPLYWNGVAHVLGGMTSNGKLVSLNGGGLLDEIVLRTAKLETQFKMDIQRQLSRIRDLNRIETLPLVGANQPGTNQEWLEEALAARSAGALPDLFAIVAKDRDIARCTAARGQDVCVPIEHAGANRKWGSRQQSHSVRRRRGDVIRCVEGDIRGAKRVQIVDYILFRAVVEKVGGAKRFAETLGEMLEIWANRDRERIEFVIDTEAFVPKVGEFTIGDCRTQFRELRDELRKKVPSDACRVAVRFWRGSRAQFPKNRYLITEAACVQVGKGFDLSVASEDLETITLLDEPSGRTIEAVFTAGKLRCIGELDLR